MREPAICLTKGMLRWRAINALSDAVNALQADRMTDAWLNYGEALTYEALFDEMLSQQPTFNFRTDSLYNSSTLYKSLSNLWIDLNNP